MNNLGRVLRLSLRYRWTVAATVTCAVLVSLLWGGNIAAVYPIVEALSKGESMQVWVDRQIADSQKEITEFEGTIAEGEKRLVAGAEDEEKVRRQLRDARNRLTAEQQALATRQWVKPLIDAYLPDDPFRTLVLIICVLLLATAVKDVFLVVGSIFVDRLTQLATFDLRKQFYRRTMRLDLASFHENSTSELMSRFTYDLDSITSGLQAILGKAIREPLKMLVCLALAAWICWRLLLLSLILAPLAAYMVSRLASSLKRANRRSMEDMSLLYNVLSETFGAIKVVKAFTMERQERRRFHHNSKKFYKRAMRIAWYNALVHPITELMGIVTICLAFLAGAYLVLNNETEIFGLKMSERPLDYGTLVVFYGLLIGASDPARKISEIFNRIQRAAAASDRVYQLLDREPRMCESASPVELSRHHREIALEGVSFGYTAGQRVLHDVNLRIPFGETLAIVGPNGCGKSTLANLIPRFFDPDSGTVRIDGVDIRGCRLRDLRKQIGVVTQETLLFDDTVYNNIRYGTPEATREEVVEAARQAHAHRFIEQKLENGYDTVVGASGNRLSGGQRQRIALARAILRDPSILILDEATSQVDLESEQLIQMVLEKFTRDRTTIIITHRLATLDLADRILVMQGGRALDIGTHQDLSGRCDLYRRLYQIHFRESA